MANMPFNSILFSVSTINSVFEKYIDNKFVCKFDVYNPHLINLDMKLPCGHRMCLECHLKMSHFIPFLHLKGICTSPNCYKRVEVKYDTVKYVLQRPLEAIAQLNANLSLISTSLLKALKHSLNIIAEEKGIC